MQIAECTTRGYHWLVHAHKGDGNYINSHLPYAHAHSEGRSMTDGEGGGAIGLDWKFNEQFFGMLNKKKYLS